MPCTRGIGAGRNGRVADSRVRRKVVDPGVREPGARAAQFGELRHLRGVTIEVIGPHPVEDDQQHRARPWRPRSENRQHAARGRRRHGDAHRRGDRDRHVLLRGRRGMDPWPDACAGKEHRNLDVVPPRRSVHVGQVGILARDDVPFAGHDHDLAGASGKVGAREHLQELSPARIGGRRRPVLRGRHGDAQHEGDGHRETPRHPSIDQQLNRAPYRHRLSLPQLRLPPEGGSHEKSRVSRE